MQGILVERNHITMMYNEQSGAQTTLFTIDTFYDR